MILSLLLDSNSVCDLRHCKVQASSNLLILRVQHTILCEIFFIIIIVTVNSISDCHLHLPAARTGIKRYFCHLYNSART